MTPRVADLAEDLRSPIADPGTRLAAVLVDALLRLVPHLSLVALGAALGSPTLVRVGTWMGWVGLALLFVVDLVLLARSGQTIGKRVMGLRIVRTSGARASLGRLFWLRGVLPTVLELVPLIGWLFGLADALAIFDADRRTLHDRIADTIVIDLRAPVPATAPEPIVR